MVLVHLAEGFEEIEALTVVDLLRRVDIPVKSVSVTGEKTVTGAHGISVNADEVFETVSYDACSMIVLPGGLPGTFGLQDHEGLGQQIKAFAAAGKPVAAICAAPLVLGHHDVLAGRKATIYPGMESHLAGGVPVDEKVVIDGSMITSQGPGTAMDFALAIVEFIRGEETAAELKRDLLLERRA